LLKGQLLPWLTYSWGHADYLWGLIL